jgi:hypothetical protein
MPSDNKPQQSDSSEGDAIDQIKPVPDQDGPHDVPDSKVIEKTLPAKGSVDLDGASRA